MIRELRLFATVILFFLFSGTALFASFFIYCIIVLAAGALAITGLFVTERLVDRTIAAQGRGRGLILAAGLAKLALMALLLWGVTRWGEAAFLFALLGLSVVVLAILALGARLLLSGGRSWNTN